MMMKRKKRTHAKQPYEGYTLPESSEVGTSFIDWNEVLKKSIGVKPKRRVVKKRRKKYGM